MTAMGDFIVFIIKMALVAAGLFLAYRIYFITKEVVELFNRKKKADELRKKLDVFSVEGEVMNFTSHRVSQLDTFYLVNISYMIDTFTYYKDIVLFNRGSLRVGQKIILLCDNDNFQNAVVQNGGEDEALKRLIWKLIWLVIWLIVDFISTCFDWKDILDEYKNAGLIWAAVLVLITFGEGLISRIKTDDDQF